MTFAIHQGFFVAQLVKNLPAMRETCVQSLGWEDPLEKGKATYSSILAWRIPWTIVHGVTKSRTQLSDFHFCIHQHESAIGIHVSPSSWTHPSWTPPPSLPHHSMLSQSTGLLFFVFLIIASLTGMREYLIVVLNCISITVLWQPHGKS